MGYLLGRPFRLTTPSRMKVCIFKNDRLGDFVLAIGAIRQLALRHGESNCLLLVSTYTKELAEAEFPGMPQLEIPAFGVDYTFEGLRRCLYYRRLLGAYEFEQLVCLRHQCTSFQELCLSWIRAAKTIRLQNDILTGKHNQFSAKIECCEAYPAQAPSQMCLELEAHRIIVEKSVGEAVAPGIVLPRLCRPASSGEEAILVSPFGSASIKEYPLEKLCEVLKRVQGVLKIPIWISCAESQKARADQLDADLQKSGCSQVHVLRTPLLADFIGMVARASVVLTVDTSTAHIAAAMDKRTVVILGGGLHGRFGPWWRSERQCWMTHPVDCLGCGWECKHPSPYCITHISADKLTDVTIQLHKKK